MVNFKKLIINNFMSIGKAEIDLNSGGFTLIDAVNHRAEDSATSNGSGKSAIAESLVWALTGETIRGHKDVVNRYTKEDCLVKVIFDFKGNNWAVERGMSRSKEKSLVIYKNNNKLESKGYRDSQEVLQKELPELTYKFINSVIILGQGLPGRFTNNSPSGRKAVLEELTNADFMITQIKDNIKRRSGELSIRLREYEDELLRARTQLDMVKKDLDDDEIEFECLKSQDLSQDKKELDELKEVKIPEAEHNLAENEKLLIKVLDESSKASEDLKSLEILIEKQVLQANSELIKSESSLKEEYSTKLLNETSLLRERMLKGEKMIKEIEEIISHLKALISGGVCRLCGQRLKSVSDQELDKAKGDLAIAEKNLSDYRILYKKLSEEESSVSSKNSTELESKIKEAKELNTLAVSEIYKKSKPELEGLKKLISTSKEEASRLSLRRGHLSEVITFSKVRQNTLESKLDGFYSRLKLLEERISNNRLNSDRVLKRISELEEKISEVNSRISVVKQMETFASRDFRGILLEGIINLMDSIIGKYSELVYGNKLTSFYLDGNSIQIEFDGKEYESLSGGEQQKMNVILQLSLRDLIIDLTGNTGSMLFLDEIFDGLDSTGCDKMINLVQSLDTSIFIISHRAESLSIPYDYVLTVIKGVDGVSHVQKRF